MRAGPAVSRAMPQASHPGEEKGRPAHSPASGEFADGRDAFLLPSPGGPGGLAAARLTSPPRCCGGRTSEALLPSSPLNSGRPPPQGYSFTRQKKSLQNVPHRKKKSETSEKPASGPKTDY